METQFAQLFDENDNFIKDSILQRRLNFSNDFSKSTYRGAVSYHKKINSKNKLQIGTKYALQDLSIAQSNLNTLDNSRQSLVDTEENLATLRNYISWKHHFNNQLTMITGFHNMNVLYNNKSTIEPRFAIKYDLKPSSKFHFGYGNHSNVESVHNYFAKVLDDTGNLYEPNNDLDLLKAHHFVLGYEHILKNQTSIKLEGYYQHLYNLPVENSTGSHYATINEGLEFQYLDLVNDGKGRNFGIELTIERYMKKGFYYLVNGSIFNSDYTALDGVTRNTQYNGDFLANILLGKEFINLGKKKNQTLNLNGKVFFGGGKKIIPLLRDNNGKASPNLDKGVFYDFEKAYDNDLQDLYLVILSASYKWNKKRTTHEVFVNLDNVTNFKGKLSEFYDQNEENNIGYVQQFGFFPNVMYRLYF